MRRIKISIPKGFRRSKDPPTGMSSLRKRLGRASRIGATILLIVSAALAVLSYRYPSIVIEVDSVISFAGAIVLLYRDTSHSVQLRVVDRILESSHDLTRSLASLNLSDSKFFYYVQRGKSVQDVVVIPSEQAEGVPDLEKETAPSKDPALLELVPSGRSLAQLFLREMPVESFGFEDLVTSLPSVVSGALGLASTASISRVNDIVEVKLLRPVLKNACGNGEPIQISLVCESCSLFAILICQASRRTVIVESCSANEKGISTIRYRLLAQAP